MHVLLRGAGENQNMIKDKDIKSMFSFRTETSNALRELENSSRQGYL
jgi:hypothetical protein